uniref:Prolactin regulatory element-binding protein n=1 Tax=Hydra vulgaris TaxID=6087 RepID=T2M4K1_HYDVU
MATYNLDQTSFPLYSLQSINDELFITCGGGGAAKTGVKNSINIYKLQREGSLFKALLIHEESCGSRAPMNLCLNSNRNLLAVGMDHLCQIYSLKKDKEKIFMKEKISVKTVEETNGDDGDYQTSVSFTLDGKHMITGSSSGSCKVFECPSFQLKFNIKKAHLNEIDDLDVHPNSKYFVSVSKDHSANLWKLEDGKKELELPFSLAKKDEDFYRFRNCRFSENLDNKSVYLFTTHIPRKNSKLKSANCIVKWDTRKWVPEQVIQVKDHSLSALAVSSNGRYVAVGTADGSVLVYISWNMTHLKTILRVHDSFVTGLSFIADNKILCEDMKQDAALLSCSIDNKCQVSLIPKRTEFPIYIILVAMLLLLYATFNCIAYFDIEF